MRRATSRHEWAVVGLVLCCGGATQVMSRSLGSKAGAGGDRRMLRWQAMGARHQCSVNEFACAVPHQVHEVLWW